MFLEFYSVAVFGDLVRITATPPPPPPLGGGVGGASAFGYLTEKVRLQNADRYM